MVKIITKAKKVIKKAVNRAVQIKRGIQGDNQRGARARKGLVSLSQAETKLKGKGNKEARKNLKHLVSEFRKRNPKDKQAKGQVLLVKMNPAGTRALKVEYGAKLKMSSKTRSNLRKGNRASQKSSAKMARKKTKKLLATPANDNSASGNGKSSAGSGTQLVSAA